MARMYANENFPCSVVERLRQLGHDVLTSREAGNADQAIPDDEVLRFAISENRAVLTLNRRDFSYWDAQEHRFVVAPGCYRVMVGASSRDIRAQGVVAQGDADC